MEGANRFRFGSRPIFLFLGCSALIWGLLVFPTFWQQASLVRVAAHIVEGDPFKADALNNLVPSLVEAEQSQRCRPIALQSAAIIRLRIFEQTVDVGERQAMDEQMGSARDAIRRALACSPADSFLWLTLFWIETSLNGFRREQLQYLRMSYRLGPNEGWIALKRSRFAFAVFSELPPDLVEATLAEFVSLIDTGFYEETVAIFTGPAWAMRDKILPRLELIAERHRRGFALALYRSGYDVDVPGIARPDPRPWK